MNVAALGLAATLLAATAPAVHTLPGGAARALTVGFGFVTLHQTQTAGTLAGIDVHIGDLPGCYRLSFVPGDPSKTSTVRMAKGGDAGAAGCPDGPAPEWVVPGAEAEAIAAVVRAWSNGALPGAPSPDLIAAETFSVTTSVVPEGSNAPEPGTIEVGIVPQPAKAGVCPKYDYDPASGEIAKLPSTC